MIRPRDVLYTILAVAITVAAVWAITSLSGCDPSASYPVEVDSDYDTDDGTSDGWPDDDTDADDNGCVDVCQGPAYCDLCADPACLEQIRKCDRIEGVEQYWLGGGDCYLEAVPDLGCLEEMDGQLVVNETYTLTDASALFQIVEFDFVKIFGNNMLDVCELYDHFMFYADATEELCIASNTALAGGYQCSPEPVTQAGCSTPT